MNMNIEFIIAIIGGGIVGSLWNIIYGFSLAESSIGMLGTIIVIICMFNRNDLHKLSVDKDKEVKR